FITWILIWSSSPTIIDVDSSSLTINECPLRLNSGLIKNFSIINCFSISVKSSILMTSKSLYLLLIVFVTSSYSDLSWIKCGYVNPSRFQARRIREDISIGAFGLFFSQGLVFIVTILL